MLDFAYAKAHLPPRQDPTENLNFLLSLVVSEAHQRQLSKPEKQFLDHLSRAVAWHYKQARANNSEKAA